MLKRDEVLNPDSCLNRALDDEVVFTLLGRDEAGPATVVAWINERIRLGLNVITDPQITKAFDDAQQMQLKRQEIRNRLGKS